MHKKSLCSQLSLSQLPTTIIKTKLIFFAQNWLELFYSFPETYCTYFLVAVLIKQCKKTTFLHIMKTVF